MGFANEQNENFSIAYEYYNKSLDMYLEIGDFESAASTAMDLGRYFELQNEHALALKIYKLH